MNLRDALSAATETLRAAGVSSPEHDAKALAVHVLGLRKPSELALHDTIDDDVYGGLVARRASRVPLQHLTGSVGFRWIELEVGPGVFVPRPETESVVQWAIDNVTRVNPLVVDLCAGSGTIAFALANEVPGATVHAVERDPVALEWTKRNAARLAAAGDPPVQLHLGSVVDCLPELDGTVDLVASNPPYVAEDERQLPEPEVIDHDPEIALFAGADGLDIIRLVEQAARRLLKPGGVVVVEHSDRQGRSAPAVFEQAGGWTEVEDHQDLTGRDRFVTARWAR
ncbi:MAG: protein-(glutamine-N5) methyltransferase, release factor-specific [Frankiales bacterium]|nr:protein-(glutamine-N5) methyltransferase, release factor-specific [Frankiales bacterium]MCW2707226.1 protein-(glutamine-N5) methyltransferase, release factor-specific [Frankiales bacterium]